MIIQNETVWLSLSKQYLSKDGAFLPAGNLDYLSIAKTIIIIYKSI